MTKKQLAQYLSDYILEELEREPSPTPRSLASYIEDGLEAFEAGAHDGNTYQVIVTQEPKELYVCIDQDQELPSYTGSKFRVLGDDGCAYDTFRDIVEVQLDAHTGAIYQLVPIDESMILPERDKIEAEYSE